MPRLVVYGRSSFCPDMLRWGHWLKRNPVEHLAFDIDSDAEALAKVVAWTGHRSVPTLVIAPDDGFDPIEEPTPLPAGRGPRGVDRGTMLTEPHPGQVEEFLERHGIAYGGPPEGEATDGDGRLGGLRGLFR
jgi:glutaredoxin